MGGDHIRSLGNNEYTVLQHRLPDRARFNHGLPPPYRNRRADPNLDGRDPA